MPDMTQSAPFTTPGANELCTVCGEWIAPDEDWTEDPDGGFMHEKCDEAEEEDDEDE